PARYLAALGILRQVSIIGFATVVALLVRIGMPGSIGPVLAWLIASVLGIVIGQAIPRSLARQRPEENALAVRAPVVVLAVLLGPLSQALTTATNAISRLF